MYITVPITKYEEVEVTSEMMIEIIKKEKENLVKGWDGLAPREDGTWFYYREGYGSHNIGEEDGENASPELIKKYKLMNELIKYYKGKSD